MPSPDRPTPRQDYESRRAAIGLALKEIDSLLTDETFGPFTARIDRLTREVQTFRDRYWRFIQEDSMGDAMEAIARAMASLQEVKRTWRLGDEYAARAAHIQSQLSNPDRTPDISLHNLNLAIARRDAFPRERERQWAEARALLQRASMLAARAPDEGSQPRANR